jgi:large subunit ribosomal protein L6
MSRIGKLPIIIPNKVKVSIENQNIEVSGPHGKLFRKVSDSIQLIQKENELLLEPKNNLRQTRELYGLSRTLVNNMVLGVSTQFERSLKIEGVGYRAYVEERKLVLLLGYSHPIIIPFPESISLSVEANVNISIKGIDKEEVGQLAATIRSKRPPEPYKGKGVLYKGEIIKRKVGKSGK